MKRARQSGAFCVSRSSQPLRQPVAAFLPFTLELPLVASAPDDIDNEPEHDDEHDPRPQPKHRQHTKPVHAASLRLLIRLSAIGPNRSTANPSSTGNDCQYTDRSSVRAWSYSS